MQHSNGFYASSELLNSGFISADDLPDDSMSLDIDKYFLETTRDPTTLSTDVSMVRCAQTNAALHNVNYSPITYDSLQSANRFLHKHESPLQKISEASFDLSDSCFLCTTSDEWCESGTTNGTPGATWQQMYEQCMQISSITEFSTKNSIESSIESEQDSDEQTFRPLAPSSLADQTSVFKRNESGRVSCKSIYSYLIKPIKNKFKNTSKKAKILDAMKQQENAPKPAQLFQCTSDSKQSDRVNFKRTQVLLPQHHSSKLLTQKFETTFADKNAKLANNTNHSIALADQFHNCGDLVYYLV